MTKVHWVRCFEMNKSPQRTVRVPLPSPKHPEWATPLFRAAHLHAHTYLYLPTPRGADSHGPESMAMTLSGRVDSQTRLLFFFLAIHSLPFLHNNKDIDFVVRVLTS